MKREIKFRGKRLDNGEWVYGDLLQIAGGRVIYGSRTDSDDIDASSSVAVMMRMDEVSLVDPATIGQFTGLRDANGKEIYEGDIIQMSCHKHDLGIVKWRNECSAFTIQEKGKLRWWYMMGGKNKVVGNIYDNSELLKGGKQ